MQAIFPGSALLIGSIIGAIELSKYVTTTWLHHNWPWLKLRYKIVYSAIVFILMLLTSMSIFGFFSKQHLENSSDSGAVNAKIEIINSKIEIEKQNIESAKKSIEQLNVVVDQVVARSDKENSIIRANRLRNQQKKERTELSNIIQESNTNIQKLNEEKFPLDAETRKLEVEVGPLKYIASLMYDNVDSTVLEKAVRFVIILIVLTFDPLAILLLIAFGLKQPEDIVVPENIIENPKTEPNIDLLSRLEKHNRMRENSDSEYKQPEVKSESKIDVPNNPTGLIKTKDGGLTMFEKQN